MFNAFDTQLQALPIRDDGTANRAVGYDRQIDVRQPEPLQTRLEQRATIERAKVTLPLCLVLNKP